MKSLVRTEELYSRSVPPEHAPGAKPLVCIGLKSPRDKTGIRNLLPQVYPEKRRRVLKLFLRLAARLFGYFMLDLHPASDDRFRLWSHLTKREGRPQVHTFDEDINRRSVRK